MATVPSPRTWSVSDLETAALFNSEIRDTERFLLGGASGRKPSLNVYSAALTYSTPNATEQALVAATIGALTVGEDTDSGWNATTGVYTFATAGLWVLKFFTAWAANTAGGRSHHLANTSLNYWNSMLASTDPNSLGRHTTTVVDRFTVNQTVQPTFYQGSGGALAINTVSFTATWIGA